MHYDVAARALSTGRTLIGHKLSRAELKTHNGANPLGKKNVLGDNMTPALAEKTGFHTKTGISLLIHV